MKHLKSMSALLAIALLLSGCSLTVGDSNSPTMNVVIPSAGIEKVATQHATLEADADGSARLQLIVANSDYCHDYNVTIGIKSITGQVTGGDLDVTDGDVAGSNCTVGDASDAELDVKLVPGEYFIAIDGEATPVTITVVAKGKPM